MSGGLLAELRAERAPITVRVLDRASAGAERPTAWARLRAPAAEIVAAALRPAATPLEPMVRAACARIARACVRADLPADALVAAARRAATVLMTEIWRRAAGSGLTQARELAGRVAADAEIVTDLLGDDHASEVWTRAVNAGTRRSAIRALLAGELPDGVSDASHGYLVTHLRVVDTGLGPHTIARLDQRARRLDTIIGVLDDKAVVLLRPVRRGGTAARAAAERALSDLVELAAGRGLCAPVAGCAHAASAARIPEALRVAAARTYARRPPVFTLVGASDSLVERALRAAPGTAVRLRGRVGPVLSEVSLAATLRVFYSCDLDRTRTAARLHVHRSTLAARLRKIRELTGIAPTSVLGIKLFSAALSLEDGL